MASFDDAAVWSWACPGFPQFFKQKREKFPFVSAFLNHYCRFPPKIAEKWELGNFFCTFPVVTVSFIKYNYN